MRVGKTAQSFGWKDSMGFTTVELKEHDGSLTVFNIYIVSDQLKPKPRFYPTFLSHDFCNPFFHPVSIPNVILVSTYPPPTWGGSRLASCFLQCIRSPSCLLLTLQGSLILLCPGLNQRPVLIVGE